jgi:hypothetical protein
LQRNNHGYNRFQAFGLPKTIGLVAKGKIASDAAHTYFIFQSLCGCKSISPKQLLPNHIWLLAFRTAINLFHNHPCRNSFQKIHFFSLLIQNIDNGNP